RRALAVLAAALVLAPSVALAQSGWYLTPSLSVGESFDDNIFRSHTAREYDFITSVTPGLQLAYQSTPLTLNLAYSSTYQKFVRHPELDNFGDNQVGTATFSYVPESLPLSLS